MTTATVVRERPIIFKPDMVRIAAHQMPGGGGVCPESGKVLGRLQENRDGKD